MGISEQLKKRRIELQMSQEVAAEKAGISRRTLAYYETGERVPNAENLLMLCNLYGLNVNDLIEIDIKESDKSVIPDVDKKHNEILEKIDRYLTFQQEKRNSFRRGGLYVAIILSVAAIIILAILVSLKFVLMSNYGFSISEATAEMWTRILNAMIDFVNDPAVQGFPVVSVVILSGMFVGWSIYLIIRIVRKKREK